MSNITKEFEYERRFFCKEFPEQYDSGFMPTLIIQNYYLSEDGYAIRIRVQSMDLQVKMTKNTDPLEILENYYDKFDLAQFTVKGPSVGGTRYEVEQSVDPLVAKEMIKRGGKTIIKNRISSWISNDGWVVDLFGGKNHDLIIAECERMSPVVDLEIPPFCLEEVTDDKRFSNDSLVNTPYSKFKKDYLAELDEKLSSDKFKTGSLYSNFFGENVIL
jgi:CYTH domain-containing protein